ncbi:Cell death specification protein 2 [Dirofilaria immitis]|nr:Cell death specification protein 2 [Dirofilaria immitis]
MDSSASIHLRNALSAVHSSQLMQNNEKAPLPIDLNTALSLLAKPASALPTSLPHFNGDDNIPLLSATVTTTNPISTPILGPSPIKRLNQEHQSVSSPPSCSSSSVTSSCSPQQSPHRKQAAPVPDDKKACRALCATIVVILSSILKAIIFSGRQMKLTTNGGEKTMMQPKIKRCTAPKEEAVAARAAFLEQENIQLRSQVVLLKNETAKLQLMLFSKPELLDPKMLLTSHISHSNISEQQQQQKPESSDM